MGQGSSVATTAGFSFAERFATSERSMTEEDLSAGLPSLGPLFRDHTASWAFDDSTGALVDRLADGLLLQAVEDNRIGTVLNLVARQLDEQVSAPAPPAGTDADARTGALAVGVRFCQILLTVAIRRHKGGADVVGKLVNRLGEATSLHTAAMIFIASGSPLFTAEDLRLRAEVLLLLLTFYSTALYHPALAVQQGGTHDVFADTFLDAAANHPDAALQRMFAGQLLLTVTRWDSLNLSATPLLQYNPGFQPSLLNMYNWFGMAKSQERVDIAAVTGVRALQVYLLLAFYKKPGKPENGFVALLKQPVSPPPPPPFELGSVPVGTGGRSARPSATKGDLPTVPIFGVSPTVAELMLAASRQLDLVPEFTLLLYLLAVHRRDALRAIAANSGLHPLIGRLTASLAHVAYDCVASTGISPMSYATGTVLLLLSRDSALVEAIFSSRVSSQASWYKERFVGTISPGSLVATVVARTAARAVALGIHDVASLHLSVLANMAPAVRDLHTIAGQRLATLLKHLMKRLTAARQAVGSDSTDYAAAATLSSLEAHCCETVDAILGMLGSPPRGNWSLLYDLLHQKAEIFTFASQLPPGNAVSDAFEPLGKLVKFYEAELLSISASHNADDVMSVIQRVTENTAPPEVVVAGGSGKRKRARAAPGNNDDGDEMLEQRPRGGDGAAHGASDDDDDDSDPGLGACRKEMFEYEEDEDSYEFFAPLIWKAVLGRSGSVLLVPPSQEAAVEKGSEGLLPLFQTEDPRSSS